MLNRFLRECKRIPSLPRVGNWSYSQHAVISTGLATGKRDARRCMRIKSEKLTLDKANKKRNTVSLPRGGLCLQFTPPWRSILRFGAAAFHQLQNHSFLSVLTTRAQSKWLATLPRLPASAAPFRIAPRRIAPRRHRLNSGPRTAPIARSEILPRTPVTALARGWSASPALLQLRRRRRQKENRRSGRNILFCR